MSGIVGLLSLAGETINPTEVDRMLDKLCHRGPHGKGTWINQNCGLGHRLLWTTPESITEKHPLAADDGNFVITADVRLDNRDELISSLGLSPRLSSQISDGELVLRAYIKWKEACPTRLLGDFSFAIWDQQNQTLFCARDHFGLKPFVYYSSSRLFAFASEVKSLLCLSSIPNQISEVRIADFLVDTLERIDKTSTWYEEIFKLPPAHYLIVNQTGIRLQSYWQLNSTQEIDCSSDQEYAAAFCEIFTEAVRCRLRSAAPIGSMLSGGLDSSSITCVARKLLLDQNRELHTFSGVSDERNTCCESPYIDAVLNLGQLNFHVIQSDKAGLFWQDFEQILDQSDDLFDTFTDPMILAMYNSAQSNRINALLEGVDGNIVCSLGVTLLSDLLHKGRFQIAFQEAQQISYFKGLWDYQSVWEPLWQGGIIPLMPHSLIQRWRTIRSNMSTRNFIKNTLIDSEFAQNINLAARLKKLDQILYQPFQSVRETHKMAIDIPNLTVALERYERVAALYSIESRQPLVDRRLVEFCVALPADQKVRRGWTKWILRQAMQGIVPDSVRWRQDQFNIRLRFAAEILRCQKENIHQVLNDSLPKLRIYINIANLERQYHQCFGAQGINPLAGWDLLKALALAKWLHRRDV
jgi:asparagine synthase (glutamine-hydrolysing)